MNSVTITAMVLIGVCCIMLATQPARGGVSRRARRDRSKARKDDQQPDQALAAHPAVGVPRRRATFFAPVHRNRWSRPDLERAFGRDIDTGDPAASVWPAGSRNWR